MLTNRSLLTTFAFLAILHPTLALNDWGKPCFEGECTYDIPDGGDASSGSLKIWADTTDAIADITTAADWEVVGCDRNALKQDIRIVCKTEDSENCKQLFSSGTAEGKLVRLPEECGKNAFARIAKSFKPEDQSVPSHIASRLVRRAGVPPEVEGLTVDADFGAIDTKKYGKIKFAIQGANVPGAKGDIPIGKPQLKKKKFKNDKGPILLGNKFRPTLTKFPTLSKLPSFSKLFSKYHTRDQEEDFTFEELQEIASHLTQEELDLLTDQEIDLLERRGWGNPFKTISDKIKANTKRVNGVVHGIAARDENDLFTFEDLEDIADQLNEEEFDFLEKRGWLKKLGKKIKNAAKKAGKTIKNAAKKAGKTIKNTAQKVGNTIKDTATDIGDKIKDVAEDFGEVIVEGSDVLWNGAQKGLDKVGDGAKKVTEWGEDALDELKKLNEVELGSSAHLEPLNIDQKFNVLHKEKKCHGAKAEINIDVNAKAHSAVTLGIVASGTIVPPNIEEFAVTATLNADFDSSIDFHAGLIAQYDTDKIMIFEAGIPGLTFPGILTVGPYFRVDVQAKALLDLNVDLNVGLNYKIEKAQVVLPRRNNHKGNFNIQDTPLKLSATPSVEASGTIEAHLIPSLNLGLEALGSKIKADVYVNLDAYAAAHLELHANAHASVESRDVVKPHRRNAPNRLIERTETDLVDRASADASGTFGGCFNIYAGLDINAGAEGSFMGFWNAHENYSLFSKTFDLYKKCFGDQKRSVGVPHASMSRRLAMHRRMNKLSDLARRSFDDIEERGLKLTCPKKGTPATQSVVDSVNALDK